MKVTIRLLSLTWVSTVFQAQFRLCPSCQEVRKKARPHLENVTDPILFRPLMGSWSLSLLPPNSKSSSGLQTRQDTWPRTSNGWMSGIPGSKCLCYSWSTVTSRLRLPILIWEALKMPVPVRAMIDYIRMSKDRIGFSVGF